MATPSILPIFSEKLPHLSRRCACIRETIAQDAEGDELQLHETNPIYPILDYELKYEI